MPLHPSTGRGLPWLLTVLSVLGPMAVDMYLPSAAGVARTFNANPVQMQQVLSAYLLGICVMNLGLGAMSDRFGRRAPMLWTTALFVGTSLGCALAASIGELIAWRFVQGMAGGSGMALALAVVKDVYTGAEARRVVAQAAACFVLAPVVAPWLGAWIEVWAGWRAIFVLLAAVGGGLLALAWLLLPETLSRSDRQPLGWRGLCAGYGRVLGNPRFLLLVVATNAPFNGLFLYIVASPVFLGEHLGLPTTTFYWFFAALMGGVALGSGLAHGFARRVHPDGQAWSGFLVMATLATVNLVLARRGSGDAGNTAIALMGYAAGWALVFPVVATEIARAAGSNGGIASSMQASVGAFGHALVAGVVAPWVMQQVWTLALATWILQGVGLVAWLMLPGRPEPATPHSDPA